MSVSIAAALPTNIEDLAAEQASDVLEDVRALKADYLARIKEINRVEQDLLTAIALLMEERAATRIEGARMRAYFKREKSGSASVYEPAQLRALLAGNPAVPQKELDAALPEITVTAVKPDLRKVRKLAELGGDVATILRHHIVEAAERTVLVVEPREINVTPETPALSVVDGGRA